LTHIPACDEMSLSVNTAYLLPDGLMMDSRKSLNTKAERQLDTGDQT
jgi:hypothetical protein